MPLKIVADENMSAIQQLFGSAGDIVTVPGRQLSREQVKDADVLLVRSVTRVDEQLLAETPVRFVGSATIGTDHIDHHYLEQQGITFAHAPGCNADAVVDYVLACLFALHPEPWFDKTLAIVGCGNVGSRLYKRLRLLGVTCLCVDPFLSERQQPDLCSLDDVVAADIVCLHTPLTTTGPYPTYHLFNEALLQRLKPGTLIINAGRGGAIDNGDLLARIERGKLTAVLDVWEGEPSIDPVLVHKVAIGTPHIAGYSLEGRLRGTLMIQQAFCQWLNSEPGISSIAQLLQQLGYQQEILPWPEQSGDDYQGLRALVLTAYLPFADCDRLRKIAGGPDFSAGFDHLRKTYPYRREFGSTTITGFENEWQRHTLSATGFIVAGE